MLRVSNKYQFQRATPDVVTLAESCSLTIEDISQMLFQAASTSPANVACGWLRKNEARWKSWTPDETRCAAGAGLVGGSGHDATTHRMPQGGRQRRHARVHALPAGLQPARACMRELRGLRAGHLHRQRHREDGVHLLPTGSVRRQQGHGEVHFLQ